MKPFILLLCASFLVTLTHPLHAQIALYEGSLSSLPQNQGWKYLTNPLFGASATISGTDAGVRLNTQGDISDQAGFFTNLPPLPPHPFLPTDPPVMRRDPGYSIKFNLRLHGESHLNSNRSGLSFIALGTDQMGIELAFWPNEIWAQSGPDFQHAEGTDLDNPISTSSFMSYELIIQGDGYRLLQNDAQILFGDLRDYSSFGTPYNIANFIFLGDNTTSAQADFEFAYMSIEPIPEPLFPSTLGGITLLIIGRILARRSLLRRKP